MDIKNFTSALSQIAEEKGIPKEKVIDSIETAIAAAYKKDYGQKGQLIKAKLNPDTGEVEFWQLKLVVSEDMIYSEEELEELKEKKPSSVPANAKAMAGKKATAGKKEGRAGEESEKIRFNPEKHIITEEAKKADPKIKIGEELKISLKARKDYGRIAAQTAKQVILQKIREAERETVFEEFKSKEGEIISGIVQRIESRNIYIDIGKTLGILPREEQVPAEFYRPGQRLKAYILKVEETPKGAVVFLSRIYPKLVSKLFELEVPEISQGQVEIKSIAREAGSRTKIAVETKEEGIDPIGSAVGQRGTRVMAVINELGGEKIDIIEYSDDLAEYISNALSPAKVLEVKILPKNKALCLVPEDQLSLAIGKDGQNVRLAAKLTGWKIDVRAPDKKGEAEKEEEGEKEEKKEKVKEKVKEKKKEKEKPAPAKTTEDKKGDGGKKEQKEEKKKEKETKQQKSLKVE